MGPTWPGAPAGPPSWGSSRAGWWRLPGGGNSAGHSSFTLSQRCFSNKLANFMAKSSFVLLFFPRGQRWKIEHSSIVSITGFYNQCFMRTKCPLKVKRSLKHLKQKTSLKQFRSFTDCTLTFYLTTFYMTKSQIRTKILTEVDEVVPETMQDDLEDS